MKPAPTARPAGVDWNRLLSLRELREQLGVAQQQLASMLGVSPRTVQSCEQGWRKPSPALERAVLLLRISHQQGRKLAELACWHAAACTSRQRAGCLAYHSGQGHLCWLLSGNSCQGHSVRSWADKKALCGSCDFFQQLVGGEPRPRPS